MCLWGAVRNARAPGAPSPLPRSDLLQTRGCRRGSPPTSGTPSRTRRSWLELQICLLWGFPRWLRESVSRNLLKKFFFGLSLVVLGISPSPFLHGLGDSGTGGRQRAEMADLAAAKGEVRDAGGRSFAQVRNLPPGAVRRRRAVCLPCPAPGNRWETSRERSLPGDSAPPTPPDASSGRGGPSLPPASA